MRDVTGWASMTPGGPVQRWTFPRRDLRADDLAVRVLFCGVCHSDLDAVTRAPERHRPLVPGHEFVGEVVAVGPEVESFAVGDVVAVGNIVDSCGECSPCRLGRENYCERGVTPTYLGVDRHDGTVTRGAWSSEIVVSRRFAYPLPSALDPAAAAPLMCAGVTVWEPLRRFAIGAGSRVGVVGLGGLGHLGVRLAVALGAEVTVFSRSADKDAAARALGASRVVVGDPGGASGPTDLDLVLDTASGEHDRSALLRTLRLDGTLCVLGVPARLDVERRSLSGRNLAASGTAGTRATAEMLTFCAQHGVVAEVEVLPVEAVGEALRRLAVGDVRWRFVLDVAG